MNDTYSHVTYTLSHMSNIPFPFYMTSVLCYVTSIRFFFYVTGTRSCVTDTLSHVTDTFPT